MKGNKKNYDKKKNMLSIIHITKKPSINEHIIKDKKYLNTAIALSDTTYSIKHGEIQTCNSNIIRLQKSLCKPVSVVIQRLSQETFKKYLYTTKNQCKPKRSNKTRSIMRSKYKQIDILSRKFKKQTLQLNDDISNIFDTNNKPENTSLNFTNNICVDDESDNDKKNDDQRINKKEVLKNVQPVVVLSNQVDENKLKSMKNVQKTSEHLLFPENIIDNNCKQNSYAHDDTKSVYSLLKMNDETPPIKEADKNEKYLGKWKYKRKYMSHEESNDILNSVKNRKKRKKKIKLHHKDLEQTMVLNNFKSIDNEVTINNLNIIDSKVMLTKLENVYDNKYIINWKKKCPQQFLLYQNSQFIEQQKDSPINILPTKTIDNSHKDVTKDSESNLNTEIELNSCILPLKCKQPKNLKVLLVKLEELGIPLKEQNLVSKVEHSTALYIDHFKMNFFNHSSDILARNECEVSSTNNESIDEALTQLNPSEKENNIMIKHPLSKYAELNPSIIQLEHNCSSPKRILQNVNNLEKFSEISSCSSEKSNVNMKYPGICTPSINEIEGISKSSKSPRIIQDEIISPKMSLLKTPLQRYLDRVPLNSSPTEVNSLTMSDETLQRNTKLKETQILPSLISKQSVFSKKCDETLKLTSEIDCENSTILQNDEKTLIDNDKHNTLEKNTDQELSQIEDLPLFIVDKSSSINGLINESTTSILKETATKGMSVDISTESIILDDIENSIKDIGLLNESLINKDSKKTISNSDIKTKTDVSNITDFSNTNLPKNVQTKEINILQSNIITLNNTIPYECIACDSSFIEFKTLQSHLKKCLKKRKNSVNDNNVVLKVSKDNDNILDICSDKTESNSQELDNSSSVLSTFSSMTSSISTNSKTKIKKLNHENQQKDKHSRRKVFKYNNKNTQCTVCLEVFDSIISLSNHIYSHTEKELQKAYQIAKSKQGLKNGSDSNITTDSSEKTQTSTSESSSSLPVDSMTIESLESDMENKKVENITNEIISKEKMRLNENQSKEVENSLEPLTIETNKEVSMTNSTVHKRNSIKFCACHKNEFENKPSIELILLCNICNILFQTRECFEAHFENEETYLCNTKRLTSREPKLYCSICQVILYSFIGMRQHMENHLKNFQSIKLFCHICKIRFIGMGPIFNLHWFNHIRNVCYVASISNFPKISIVDSTSEEWSIITSDQFKYLIVTEHICDVCNAQCFSKNQLKIHKSSCTENSKLPSIVPANDHKNQSIHSKLNLHLSCNICNLTFSQKSLYEEHIASHKNNLRSQYICSSATDIKKTYFCNICKNVYENLKEFMIHWQKHNMIRKSLMHNQAKTDFSSLKSYLENSKEYDTTIINNTSCQETNHKMDFTCKICNLSFDSSEALHKHTCTRNKEFPNLITVHSSNACNDSNEQKISSVYPTELEPNLIKPMIISAQLTNEIESNDSADPVNENILEVIENENSTINQTIDSSKSLTNSKSIESVKTEFDDVSVSDNRSTIDQDLESLLSISDVKTDDSNVTESNYFVRNNKSSTFMNKSEEKERTTGCNVNNDLDKYDNIKDSNNKNTVIVKSTIDLKKKDVLVNNPPLSENININETQDNITPVELKISEKNQNNFKETVKSTTSFQPNNSTETNEESVKTKKYLRVKNISELIDQKLKYNSYNKNDQDGNTDILASSSVAMDLSNQKQTKNLIIEPHPVIRELNTKQNSVPGSSKAYKMIIIDHSLTEKQAVYVPHYESNSSKQGFVCSTSAEKTTCIPAPQSKQEATSQSGQTASSILKPQSGQRGIPMSAQQSTHRATPESGQRTTPIPIIPRSGQRITPISIMTQSRQKVTSIPYSAQTTTLIPVPYSAQTPTAMPILRSALSSVTPFRAPYTSQSQVSNVQYASVKPVTTNPYPMNPRIIKAVTYVPSLIIQPQNVSHNQSALIASSSSILTNSSANNYMNNTYVTQRNNIALCKTTSTSMISNLQLTNNFSNQNMRMGQPHDTHSTVKMQNAVHNTCSNRTAKVMSVNMRSRNSIELYTNNEISSLPVSSDQNYYYNTSNVKYSSTNVRNLNMMQMQYSKQDNNLTNNGVSVQRQSNNLLQMSTVCQPVVSDSHSVMSLQQPHVHDQPSTNVGSSQFMHSLYTCKFCPKPLHFSTVEELDYHLNLYHKFFCSICNVRLYSSTEIDIHKLKHESLLL